MSNIVDYLLTCQPWSQSLWKQCKAVGEEHSMPERNPYYCTGILKYGAQFNEDSQPIPIEFADMSVALKGENKCNFEDSWVLTQVPTSVDIYPYRPI